MLNPPNPLARLTLVALAACATAAGAETVNVTVDSSQPWVGYVNVFERPTIAGTDRGAYLYGSFYDDWQIGLLPASVTANVASLAPNGSIGGAPTDFNTDWWTSDGSGGYTPNRVFEANLYLDSGFTGVDLGGKTVHFTGTTIASSLVAPYVAYAFIRDFAAGYDAGYTETIEPLVAGQAFNLSMATGVGHAVQYGFSLVGPNADPDALPSLGSIAISAVPEPATPAMLLLGALAVAAWVRRRH